MLKRITLIVVILIFAKPAYDFFIADYDAKPYKPDTTQTAVSQISEPPINGQTTNASGTVTEDVTTSEQEENEATTTKTKVDSEGELTQAIYQHLSQFNGHFTIQYVGSTKNIDAIIERASKAASKMDPFVEGHLSTRNITYSYNKLSAKIDVQQTYLISKQEAQYVDERVTQIIHPANANTMSDYEKVKFVNDYIVQNTVYSDQTTSSPHSAYTILTEGKAVCQGYALLAQKMLTKLGIESLYVVGEAGGVGHAWNLVKLEGQWFHLDTTWNDPLPDRGKQVRYDYFLVPDSQLAQDHTWVRSDYPQATSSKFVIK